MISRKTVFVLGAGASHPFGLPTGGGLRAVFCEHLSEAESQLTKTLTACGFTANMVRAFGHAFMYSGVVSIDSFLATRSEYHDIGLHAIAATLLPTESRARLYKRGNPGQMVWGDSDWYGYLWNRLRADVTHPDHLVMNQVSFITFNYDRTWEVFLLNAIQHTFGLERDAAFEILRRIPIHHVYGSLGEYEPGKAGFGLGRNITPDLVKASAKGLLVMPSARPASDQRCIELLNSAETVIFLGFGFDATNCQRLGFREVMDRRAEMPEVGGTVLGLEEGERELADGLLRRDGLTPDLLAVNCLQYLRHRAYRLDG